jgi:hypothetical protein
MLGLLFGAFLIIGIVLPFKIGFGLIKLAIRIPLLIPVILIAKVIF